MIIVSPSMGSRDKCLLVQFLLNLMVDSCAVFLQVRIQGSLLAHHPRLHPLYMLLNIVSSSMRSRDKCLLVQTLFGLMADSCVVCLGSKFEGVSWHTALVTPSLEAPSDSRQVWRSAWKEHEEKPRRQPCWQICLLPCFFAWFAIVFSLFPVAIRISFLSGLTLIWVLYIVWNKDCLWFNYCIYKPVMQQRVWLVDTYQLLDLYILTITPFL